MDEPTSPDDMPKKIEPDSAKLWAYLRVFLVPTLFNKALILYFGINYSNYPGEGYGYGLAACFAFLLLSMGWFIWTQWDTEEES